MATGFFLACTLGCKMVGLFTFFTIGAAVVADLWNLLDYKKGLTMVSYIQPWREIDLSNAYSDVRTRRTNSGSTFSPALLLL